MNVESTQNFKITPLGEQERWVYDVEVEDNHNFFANDILVHNSNYINLGPLVEKMMPGKDREFIVEALDGFFRDKVEPFIQKSYQELYEYLNNYQQLMIMDREAIADKGIFVSKKRYLLRVYDNEGIRYEKPKMKIMGLSIIKSDTPEVCRNKIKASLDIILDGTNGEMIQYIDEFRKEWNKLPPEDFAISKSANKIKKYESDTTLYVKGTPIQSKAAIIHNMLVEKYGLDIAQIEEGNKLNYLLLKEPNPTGDKVIGFENFLPEDFRLHAFVDYRVMFDKAFISPLSDILDAINWDTEKRASLF